MRGERQNGIPPPGSELIDSSTPQELSLTPFNRWLRDFEIQSGVSMSQEQVSMLSRYFDIRNEINLSEASYETNQSINQFSQELDETEYADSPDFNLALRSITVKLSGKSR